MEDVQSRFSCTVGANDGDSGIEANIDIDALQQDLVRGISKRDLVQLENRRRDLLGIWKLERLGILFFWRGQLWELL